MRAAVISKQGGSPEVTSFENPTPKPHAVVIDVVVGAVGPTDLYKAEGLSRVYPGAHIVNGEGVGHAPDGKRVYFGHSILPYGAWAESTLVAESEVWPIPENVEDEQAAAMGISGTAALIALEQAKIRSGERVLVLGATGVLGQIGLQIAREMGAGTVVAAARNAEVLGKLVARGWADDMIQIGQGDDITAFKTAGGGWNVVLDCVYGAPGAAALKTSAMGARIMCVSRMAGPTMTVDLMDLGYKTMAGVGTGIRPVDERRAAFARLMGLASAGKIKIDILRYALDDAAAAWTAQKSSPYGKIVVRP